jgi:hypothetical protein
VISPLLANIYLHELDASGSATVQHIGILVRYADDFVVLCHRESQANEAMRRLREIFARLKLVLHPEKTKLVQIGLGKDGFDFLGCHLRIVKSHFKGRTYLFRWPSAKTMKEVRTGIRDLTDRRRRAGLKDVDEVIADLNPVLKGWGNYFRTGNAEQKGTAVTFICFTAVAIAVSLYGGLVVVPRSNDLRDQLQGSAGSEDNLWLRDRFDHTYRFAMFLNVLVIGLLVGAAVTLSWLFVPGTIEGG